jgi:hypothetical protein
MPGKKSIKKRCPKGTIRNPKSSQCVSETGAIGKKLVKARDAKKAKKDGSKSSPNRKSIKKKPAKPRCPKGTIRNPKSNQCVSETGAIGKKLVKARDAKKTGVSKGPKSSKSYTKIVSEWPKPFPIKDLDYLNTKKYKPSISKVRKTAEKYAEKYENEETMYIINKVIQKLKKDSKSSDSKNHGYSLEEWTDKRLRNYLLGIFWNKTPKSKLVLKYPDLFDIDKAIMKRIFEKDIKNSDDAVEDIYKSFDEDLINGYPIHKNPFYSKSSGNEKYYNELKNVLKDRLNFQQLIMESYTLKNRKKLLEQLSKY